MPLTPAEVHNVVFKKPPIGKRGYDEEEVDAFLDIIEVELSRLIEENTDLRNGSAASGGPDPAVLNQTREENKRLSARVSELEAALSQARQAQPAPGNAADAAALSQARDESKRLSARVSELETALSQARQQTQQAQQAAAQAQQEAAAAKAAGSGAAAAAAGGAGAATQLAQAERVLALAQQAADEQTSAAKAHYDKT